MCAYIVFKNTHTIGTQWHTQNFEAKNRIFTGEYTKLSHNEVCKKQKKLHTSKYVKSAIAQIIEDEEKRK